jgi:hypothetical protein
VSHEKTVSNNHPNRNWRARMQSACDQWLSSAAQVLYVMPQCSDEPARTEGLRNRIRTAYLAGYIDGRKRS